MSILASIASQLFYFLALRYFDPSLSKDSPRYATYQALLSKSNKLQEKYVKPSWERRKKKQANKRFIVCAVNQRPDVSNEQ